jgi:hypothetical protein
MPCKLLPSSEPSAFKMETSFARKCRKILSGCRNPEDLPSLLLQEHNKTCKSLLWHYFSKQTYNWAVFIYLHFINCAEEKYPLVMKSNLRLETFPLS